MHVTSIDRGRQLDAFRMAEQLTDVTLLVEGVRIPAHKLVLSLHSHYFRLTLHCLLFFLGLTFQLWRK